MTDQLYELMDWEKIEGLVYSEEDHPKSVLGPRVTEEGVLIQCFFPGETHVALRTLEDKKLHLMTQEDEEGFFAVLLKEKKIPPYVYVVGDKTHEHEVYDAYAYPSVIREREELQFEAGICYDIYEKLGAHPMEMDGVAGTHFAVWAPNAMRVSVVGDFCSWDGRQYPMERREKSGIFELFLPQVQAGAVYKYEIKTKRGDICLKADPYAFAAQLRSDTASVVADLTCKWHDQVWMAKRKKLQTDEQPTAIYQVHLGSWMVPEDREESYFHNYREIAVALAAYVKNHGYTHIELMPVMEHPLDESGGMQTSGFYAPTARYGTPADFQYFMDYMHQQEIGVILAWVPAWFAPDDFSLGGFDGTCLYEHQDPRQGVHPSLGTKIFNYGRPQVSNFLIANALFWADKYHADGLRMSGMDVMLYLDYGREDGAWVANMYGGNENLEAVAYIKHLNSIFRKRFPDAWMIAEETCGWPLVTAPLDEDGLGFHYKWNNGWKQDLLAYMQKDPLYRSGCHNDLIFSMVYAYSEKFLLALDLEEMAYTKGSLLDRMPGDEAQKLANLRLVLGYMTAHPGKKLLAMGQDQGVSGDWQAKEAYPVSAPETTKALEAYMQDLMKTYKSYPALAVRDFRTEGFAWINELDSERNLLVFLRKGRKKEDTLLVVCNFSGTDVDALPVGVPYPGKYKEVFNTDQLAYGGTGKVNPRVKMSKPVECDERKQSITMKLGALSLSIFTYTEVVEKLVDNQTAKKTQTTKSRQTGKKPAGKNLLKELKEKVDKEEHKA